MPDDGAPERFWTRIARSSVLAPLVYIAGFAWLMRTANRDHLGSAVVDLLLVVTHWGLLALWLLLVVRHWRVNRREWREYRRACQSQGATV